MLLNIGRGLSEEEFEFFRERHRVHFFVLVERGVVAIEVVSRTRLGKISETALFRAPDGLDGVDYWTLAPEAYAVSQATRPDGPRDVARFRLAKD